MKLTSALATAVFALGLAMPTHAQASLIAYWDFDETTGLTASDSIGGVNGALTGGASFTGTGGILGGAVAITDGFVNMGKNFPSTSTFSIQAWVRTAAADVSGMTPVARHHATISQGYFLSINNVNDGYTQTGKAGFFSSGGGSYQTAVGGSMVNNGEWHQLVGVYNNGTTTIYVDGAFAGTGAGGFSTPDVDFLVGGVANSSGTPINLYHGLIDEVKIFNTALTDNEVASLYQSTLNPAAVPEPSSIALFCMGGIGILTRTRRRKIGAV